MIYINVFFIWNHTKSNIYTYVEPDLEKINNEKNMNTFQSKETVNYSKSIHLSIKINPDEESMDYMNQFNAASLFSKHALFSPASLGVKTSINEHFTVFISLLKNRTYQLYKLNRHQSGILKNIQQRIDNGDFVGNSQFVPIDTIWEQYFHTLMDHSAWLSEFGRQLLGFDKFDAEDFSSIVEAASPLLLGVHWSEYVKSNESFKMIGKIQLTSERIRLIFGTVLAELIIQFDTNFSQLKLNEFELGNFVFNF